ncbi:MAG: hypothetical protein AAGJ46_12415 [Planctomycetota bacterium]
MAKALTIAGMVVAGLTAVAFGMDMVLGFPFQGASTLMDVGSLIAALILGYLSWNAFSDIR